MKFWQIKNKHIFCIEGSWSNDLKDKSSIHAALEFLNVNAGINNIRKDCTTKDQFELLLKTSLQKRYQDYPIIYLAYHGSPGKLHLGPRTILDFNEIAEILDGKAKEKIVHFGSCSTLLDLTTWDLKRFLKNTGALAVSGYTKDIGFIESTVLDILYFKKLQEFKYQPLIKTNKEMNLYYGKLIKELGFKMYFNK